MGSRRLAKLLPTFVGRIIFLATIKTSGKELQLHPRDGRPPLERGGRPSSRAQGAETAIAKGGAVSLGVDESGEEGVPVVT